MDDLRVDSSPRLLNGNEGVKDSENSEAHETDSGIHSGDDVVDKVSDVRRGGDEGTGNRDEYLRRGETVVEVYDLEEQDLDGKSSGRGTAWEGLSLSFSDVEDLQIINLDERGESDKEEEKFGRKRTSNGEERKPRKRVHKPFLRENTQIEILDTSSNVSSSFAKPEDQGPKLPDSIEIEDLNKNQEEKEEVDEASEAVKTNDVKKANKDDPQENKSTIVVEADSAAKAGTNPSPEIRIHGNPTISLSQEPELPDAEKESNPSTISSAPTQEHASPTKRFVSKSFSDGTIITDPSKLRLFQPLDTRVSRRGIPSRIDIQEDIPEDPEDESQREARMRMKMERLDSRTQLKDTLTVPGERRASRSLEGRVRISRRGSLAREERAMSSMPSSPEDEEDTQREPKIQGNLTPGKEVGNVLISFICAYVCMRECACMSVCVCARACAYACVCGRVCVCVYPFDITY